MHPHNADELLSFYESRVLPALYERLDRAFPELELVWTGDGWKGVKKTDGGVWNRAEQTAIVANHPWGFVTRSGAATSWLAYVSGGVMPNGVALAAAIRKLADLAGVACNWQPARGSFEGFGAGGSAIEQQEVTLPPYSVQPEFESPRYWARPASYVGAPTSAVHGLPPMAAQRELPRSSVNSQRQAELWEAFVAFCHECLCTCTEGSADPASGDDMPDWPTMCASMRDQLQKHHGIDVTRTDHLPLGVFPSPVAVHEHLLRCGFTEDEIKTAAVVSDTRLPGRVIIPWRDSLGRIATIIAEDVHCEDATNCRRLYIKGTGRPAVFGLDVAFRPAAGGVDELILVDNPLDVVFFQQNGLPNVAMMSSATKAPTKQDWEVLGDLGVQNVTLALSDDTSGAARTCKSLLDASHPRRVPHAFALPFGALETCHGAGDYARTHGVARLMQLLGQRQHGYKYLAQAIIRRHRPGKQTTRTAINEIMREAIAFDATVFTAAREGALDHYFWAEIMKATNIDWRAVRPRLRHRPMPLAATNDAWQKEEVRQSPDIDWVNGLLNVVAEEQSEQFHPLWTHDPLPPGPRLMKQRESREPEISYDDIRARAYQLWEQNGRPAGAEQQCWTEAERSLRRERAARSGHRAA